MPNSARDLLPMIQPATKALAQMLAGRTGASGQLGHARAILAQTERLVADRAHNRLNPAEREEFFEQVARLKLTLADAESEAEVDSMEEETPPPAPAPVDRERLREMALALTSSGAAASQEERQRSEAAANDARESAGTTESVDSEPDRLTEAESSAAVARPPSDPNQLRLPRGGAERVTIQPDGHRPRTNGRRPIAKPDEMAKRAAAAKRAAKADPGSAPATSSPRSEPTKSPTETKTAKPRADAKQKLPKGWIIDEEGFVVPGPAA